MIDIFEIYSIEAKYGRLYIDADLSKLSPGSEVLEVGAGCMLLSCQLKREGYDVTALEPDGEGFTHFTQLREFINGQAALNGHSPKLIRLPAERLDLSNKFDFAFSIFVMEHVDDIAMSLLRITTSLKPGSTYRFITPNYTFPYEPHFNIPTFGTKKLTESLMGWKIFTDKRFPNPRGVWSSLNWITVKKLTNAANRNALKIQFNKSILYDTFLRVIYDEKFSSRRSNLIVILVKIVYKLKITRLLKFIPIQFSPIIDCTVYRKMNNIKV